MKLWSPIPDPVLTGLRIMEQSLRITKTLLTNSRPDFTLRIQLLVRNENSNGLIGQYLPKNRDLTTIGQKEINPVMIKLNNQPPVVLAN